MRRSIMTLTARMDTAGSMGCKWIGIETRSFGPMGFGGESTLYRRRGMRGLEVVWLRRGSGEGEIGICSGRSYRTSGS